jgi:hypothetical protein
LRQGSIASSDALAARRRIWQKRRKEGMENGNNDCEIAIDGEGFINTDSGSDQSSE